MCRPLAHNSRPAHGALLLGGGAMLTGSALLPWVSSGPGHSLRGADMVHRVAALDGRLAMFAGSRLVVLWFLVPILGSLVWVAVGVAGSDGKLTRVLCLVAALVGLVAVWLFQRAVGLDHLGSGAWLAAVGAVLAASGALVARRA